MSSFLVSCFIYSGMDLCGLLQKAKHKPDGFKVADLLAVGTVMSVHLCGGKYIPYQYGRIDATEADPRTGVPEVGTSIEATLAQFEQAGFNQADAIGLTACGHTIGSVSRSLPLIVGRSTH